MALPTTLKNRLLSNLWRTTTKATAQITSTDDGLFTVGTGGNVMITMLLGEMTIAHSATLNNCRIKHVPTATGTDVFMSAASLDLTGLAIGGFIYLTGDKGAFAEKGEVGQMMETGGMILGPGLIEIQCSASPAAGSAKWFCSWIPIDVGASVAAA